MFTENKIEEEINLKLYIHWALTKLPINVTPVTFKHGSNF